MAIRIRKNGKIVCAAMNPERKGDVYVNDNIHYILCRAGVLVTEPWEQHKKHKGEWWWITQLPFKKYLDGISTDGKGGRFINYTG